MMVDGDAQRNTNEAAPYVDAVDAMYDAHERTRKAIPSFLVFDQPFRNRYPFIKIPPRAPFPKA